MDISEVILFKSGWYYIALQWQVYKIVAVYMLCGAV
jgi:hypothetical protein